MKGIFKGLIEANKTFFMEGESLTLMITYYP